MLRQQICMQNYISSAVVVTLLLNALISCTRNFAVLKKTNCRNFEFCKTYSNKELPNENDKNPQVVVRIFNRTFLCILMYIFFLTFTEEIFCWISTVLTGVSTVVRVVGDPTGVR